MTIKIDRKVYPDTCISKCIYFFLDKYCFERSLTSNIETIKVSAKDGIIEDKFISTFNERLNDYKLREIIEKETKDLRTILYAKAFADYNDISIDDI